LYTIVKSTSTNTGFLFHKHWITEEDTSVLEGEYIAPFRYSYISLI